MDNSSFQFILVIFLVTLLSSFTFGDYLTSPIERQTSRTGRSLGEIFRRFFGRKQNNFQETGQPGQGFATQSSSFYPTYSFANPFANQQLNSANGYHNFGSAFPLTSNIYPNLPSVGPYAQAANAYPSYVSPSSFSGNSNENLDFHAILDQFVRSAGLTPAGDQDTAASSIQAKGDAPVFSFKKLYSFPFYLSTDNHAQDGYNLQIPFMRKHIRRMSDDKLQYLKQMQDKFKLLWYQQKMQEKKNKPEQQWEQAYIFQNMQKYYTHPPVPTRVNPKLVLRPEINYPAYYYGNISDSAVTSIPSSSFLPSTPSMIKLHPNLTSFLSTLGSKTEDKVEENNSENNKLSQDMNRIYVTAS